jgi:hypothetical protein
MAIAASCLSSFQVSPDGIRPESRAVLTIKRRHFRANGNDGASNYGVADFSTATMQLP